MPEFRGRVSDHLGGSVLTAQTLADTCLVTLQRAMDNPRVRRNIQEQLQRTPHAILPLLSLGSEWDPSALWNTACALDSRMADTPFDANDHDDVGRLEATLDSISSEIMSLLLEAAQRLIPELSLSHGLVDGEWAIYAVIPREVTLPTLEQPSLW